MQNTKLSRRNFIKAIGAGFYSLSISGCSLPSAQQKRPNIIVIMVDDMGFSDPGCFGGEVKTPNIDSLAQNGLRFTRFYNCARCCPTRASLMTGLYSHQVGLTFNGRSLSRNGVTIPEALKTAGYNTAMAGKWHLSYTIQLPDGNEHQKWLDHQIHPDQPFGPLESYPVNRGFDKHYGVIWGVIDYFDPFSLVDGTETIREVDDDYYFTEAVNNKSIEYIREMSESDRPFFMYLAHCAPHWPLHALPKDIEKYKDTYTGGWDKLRKDRFARQLKMGLFKKENTQLPEVQTGGRKWQELSEEQKAFEARKMAVHAAMIDRIDQGIGRLMKTLKDTGQFDNTLIFFLADNGASPEIMTVPGYDRPSQTREGKPLKYQTAPLDEIGSQTTYLGIGRPWASASNTPFRYWKKESFEGGCHTPMIVHWPAGLKTKKGSVTSQVGHVMDIMPSCLEAAGINYPETYKDNRITPVEGKSLMPIIRGQKRQGHDIIFFEHERGRAVRMGDWKLVAFSHRNSKWELYNLKDDVTEMNNLAAKYPEQVELMAGQWKKWAEKVGLERK